MSQAHVVLDIALGADGKTLEIIRAGIYGSDHHGLTRNLKLVGATVVSVKAETYSKAVEKCFEYVTTMKGCPAWDRLHAMLEARR